MIDNLTRLTVDDPHGVKAYVVTITAADTASGTCTVDAGDGDPVAGVPYFGAAPGVGSTQVAFLFDQLLVVLTAGTGGASTDPALPEPLTNVQNTDITITTSSRHQEPSTSTRCSITNPHPTKKLLVHGWAWCWMAASSISATTSLYLDVDPLGSTMDEAGAVGALMTPTHTRWDAPQGVNTLQTAMAQAYYYVPPATTGTIFASGARTTAGCTYLMRGTMTSLIPIRYA